MESRVKMETDRIIVNTKGLNAVEKQALVDEILLTLKTIRQLGEKDGQ